MTLQIAEAAPLAPKGTRWRARIIQGDIWGSSGYYPAEVLAEDGPNVFPEGTHVYVDHPGMFEQSDRPVRSVRDLAGRIASTPIYEGDGLYADVEFVSWVAPVVAELAEDIGLSIRASATGQMGERDGRHGLVIDRLVAGVSVDLVTHAGAGGRLVQALESARPNNVDDDPNTVAITETAALTPATTEAHEEASMTVIPAPVWEMFEALRAPDPDEVTASAVAHGVQEATANDTREALQGRLREEYGAERVWVWVRDFDDTTVWYEVHSADDESCYAEGYTLADDLTVTLAGSRTEVRPVSSYVEVTDDGETSASEAVTDPAETGTPAPESGTTEPLAVTTDPVAENGDATPADGSGTPTDPTAPAVDAAEAAHPSQEDTMSNTQGAGGSAPTSPRQVIEARIAAMERQNAEMRANQQAGPIIAEVLSSGWISEAQRARLTGELTASVPLTESLELDAPTLRARATEALERAETEAAEILNGAGYGTPRGLSAFTSPATEAAQTQHAEQLAESLKVFGLSDAATQTAVKGR